MKMEKLMMPELKILPEIEENLFPLQPEELKFLEESIFAEGVRDALVVWLKDRITVNLPDTATAQVTVISMF